MEEIGGGFDGGYLDLTDGAREWDVGLGVVLVMIKPGRLFWMTLRGGKKKEDGDGWVMGDADGEIAACLNQHLPQPSNQQP